MSPEQKRYCSLDLELTGFDPSRDTILEVGFVFFTISDTGLKIEEEWSQTFSTHVQVAPKILGLTGITLRELEDAPEFSEFREEIQEKIGDAILVGHNILMDAKFLEAFGITLSGKFIDTLDLVQFLLPTYHSYNLENLMHYFQIPHPKAHRALADSIAVVQLLEQQLFLFKSFPEELQAEIIRWGRQADFEWIELFQYPLLEHSVKNVLNSEQKNVILNSETQKIPENTVVIKPFASTISNDYAFPENTVVAVPNMQQAMQLWKEGKAKALFLPTDLFNAKKFERFIARPALGRDEIKFVLKILVWRATNWQSESIIDLNLSFFGGQYRAHISEQSLPKSFNDPVLCADYETLDYISKHCDLKNYNLYISNTHKFEQALGAGTERKLSWQGFLYAIRNFEYRSQQIDPAHLSAESISEALTATDLFFGLVILAMQKTFPKFTYISIVDLENYESSNASIKDAAGNYIQKINTLLQPRPGEELYRMLYGLETFFISDTSSIRWIDYNATNCIFHSQPLHVETNSKNIIAAFASVSAIEDFPQPVLGYITKRLGMHGVSVKDMVQSGAPARISLKVFEDPLETILVTKSLPGIAIMGSTSEIKAFYDSHYQNIKQFASLYAQGYSGGSNKILRNFKINPASVLLVTNRLLLQHDSQSLSAKTVIFTNYPQENRAHPYTKALFEHWKGEFPDILSILDTYLMYRLISTLWNPELESIFLPPPRNEKEQYVFDSLNSLGIFK